VKRFLKIVLWSVVSVIVLAVAFIAVFVYKIKNGFPVSYETKVPAINFPANQTAVLLFSKSTGFRHGESIDAGKKKFEDLAKKNNWFLYSTEEGGVFNAGQLAKRRGGMGGNLFKNFSRRNGQFRSGKNGSIQMGTCRKRADP